MLRGMKRNAGRNQELPMEQPQGRQQLPGKKPSKAQVEQVKTLAAGMIDMAHDERMSKHLHQMLQAGQPQVSVPQAAMTVYQQFKNALGGKAKMGLEMRLSAYTALTGELIEFGNEAGIFNLNEQGVTETMQNSFQLFVETGLKDKSIDPIELQEVVEPLMNSQQQQLGNEAAQQTGVPGRMSREMATEQHANKKVTQAQGAGGMLAPQGGGQR